MFCSFNAETDIRRQNLTSLDVRFWRLMSVSALKGLMLVQRRRRLPNIKKTLGRCPVFCVQVHSHLEGIKSPFATERFSFNHSLESDWIIYSLWLNHSFESNSVIRSNPIQPFFRICFNYSLESDRIIYTNLIQLFARIWFNHSLESDSIIRSNLIQFFAGIWFNHRLEYN